MTSDHFCTLAIPSVITLPNNLVLLKCATFRALKRERKILEMTSAICRTNVIADGDCPMLLVILLRHSEADPNVDVTDDVPVLLWQVRRRACRRRRRVHIRWRCDRVTGDKTACDD